MACFCGGSAANQVVPDPIPDFDDTRLYLGQHGYTRRIRNKKGLDLYAYFWPCDPCVPLKGVVQLAHGNATYICFDYLKFVAQGQPNIYAGSWVEAMNKAGFAVAGIDHQGFGRSKGVRSYIDRFQDHVDNLMLLSDHLASNERSSFPVDRVPHFLVGHSMGGLASTLACVQRPGRYAGLVLIAPMLSLAHRLKETGNLRYALKVLAAVAPKLEVGDSSTIRHVPWIYDAWDADPYVYDGRMRARNVEEFFKATEQLNWAPGLGQEQEDEGVEGAKEGVEEEGGKGKAAAEGEGAGEGKVEKKRKKGRRRTAKVAPGPDGSPPDLGMMTQVALPLLVFQSERDTHVEPDGARRLIARASTHDKTLRMLTKQWHVLSKEEGWEELCLETVEWLAARADGKIPAPSPAEAMGGSGGYSTGQQQPPSHMPQQHHQQGTLAPAQVVATAPYPGPPEPHTPSEPMSSYQHQHPETSAASASGRAARHLGSSTANGGEAAAADEGGDGAGAAATGPMGEPLAGHSRFSHEQHGAGNGGPGAGPGSAEAARASRDTGVSEEGGSTRPSGLPPLPGSGTGGGSGGGAVPLPPMPPGGGHRSIGGLAPLAPIQQRRSLGQPPPELESAPGGAAGVYTGAGSGAGGGLPPLRPMTARSRLPPI